ncbi:HNH endonuclease [compost metagenome]
MIGMSKIENKFMDRKEMYSIEEVLSKIVPINVDKKESKVDFDGDMIPMSSHRYHNFKEHGVVCVCCGIKGEYFVKERSKGSISYHFNLYAIDENKNEVLMTKDHIVAKSQGGPNRLENYQPMCTICNKEKGYMSNEEFKQHIANKQNSVV